MRYYRDPHGYLRLCHRKYGDWFTIKLIPCGNLVCVAEPTAARAVFREVGSVGEAHAFLAPVLGQGLPLLDGEPHASAVRWIAPALTSARMQPWIEEISRLTASEVASWPVGRPFALRPRFEQLAMRVMLRVLFGEGAHERVATLGPLILRLKSRDLVQSVLAALPFGLAKWRLIGESARTAQAIDACIHAELAARRAGTVVNDGALAHLVAPRPDGTVATDRELRDQLMTLIFAGHENVATTLAWTFERVLRHPAVLGQLVEPGRDDRYPAAVLMEAMRQRPVIAEVVRELAEPFEHGDHALPTGTHISVAIAALHMRADLFADPEVFRPERFLDDASTTWTTPEAAIYHPFGGGARRCLGADFAMLQLRTIMSTVLAQADLRAPDSAAERGVSNGMAVGPHRGALVVMERRR
ncbi:MAG: cytochrome P450 [Myxococcales bacterium]|nr:cytochrome P450 [Myxococcales bacterium]